MIKVRSMKKQLKYIFLFLIFICLLTGCFSQALYKKISATLGIKIPANVKIEYEDTHGGFHGDGESFAKIVFDPYQAEEILRQIESLDSWHELPLSENLHLIMYGGEKDNVEYAYNFAKSFGIPHVKNGYWFFVDRHDKSSSPEKDENIFKRSSFNFTLAIYDIDTNTLYFFELDT
ncbi:MAG TPA: hypothetical protein PK768_02455 [Tepidanaerobacteraceae bacterium]|nr:hypothetical protein [Tepidanaerobacteraceae bacterium]